MDTSWEMLDADVYLCRIDSRRIRDARCWLCPRPHATLEFRVREESSTYVSGQAHGEGGDKVPRSIPLLLPRRGSPTVVLEGVPLIGGLTLLR